MEGVHPSFPRVNPSVFHLQWTDVVITDREEWV